MVESKITYPQYRKYANDKSYFKVISSDKFEEIQIIGTKVVLHIFEAKILPDRNYIYDLTFNHKENWIECSAEEYENLKATSQ
jgi:hypothetical protein